ncbi:MAG: hypothetical protein WEE66_13970 [Actinomycetota bacterium]
MARTVGVIAMVLVGCAGGPTPGDAPGSSALPAPLVLPASALPRMTSDASPVDGDRLANEVVHPDELRAVLGEAGFTAGAQRSFGAGTGAFSRVLARGLAFETDAGAAAFVTWFGDNAGEEVITAERISPADVPDGVVVFRHLPDGCCHNDVPVYLAAWQRGPSVLYLHVGGRRANTRAFVELIASYDQEV